MKLIDIINRRLEPVPWDEGDNIPWNESGFSERMLLEHLSQEHDAASRRSVKLDQHVEWIQREVLHGRPSRILDLGCGPGLYTERLARLGHTCTGIDFSPASIRYARETEARAHLNCNYVHDDLRHAAYGNGYGLAMFLFGEFNVFRPTDIRSILHKAHDALAPNGLLLIESSTYDSLFRMGHLAPHWATSSGGLFSAFPHLELHEYFWDEAIETATRRWMIIDAASSDVALYAATYQAYSTESVTTTLSECGFESMRVYPSLIGIPDETQSDFMVIVASAMA
ncbi:MAG TPA: class I SAM-dependent methyltransferase [Anaerolineae bacterium]|jgi:SAM-dependent methyltransferase